MPEVTGGLDAPGLQDGLCKTAELVNAVALHSLEELLAPDMLAAVRAFPDHVLEGEIQRLVDEIIGFGLEPSVVAKQCSELLGGGHR